MPNLSPEVILYLAFLLLVVCAPSIDERRNKRAKRK